MRARTIRALQSNPVSKNMVKTGGSGGSYVRAGGWAKEVGGGCYKNRCLDFLEASMNHCLGPVASF